MRQVNIGSKIAAIAKGWIGQQENGHYGKDKVFLNDNFVSFLRKTGWVPGQEWCSAFATACIIKGLEDLRGTLKEVADIAKIESYLNIFSNGAGISSWNVPNLFRQIFLKEGNTLPVGEFQSNFSPGGVIVFGDWDTLDKKNYLGGHVAVIAEGGKAISGNTTGDGGSLYVYERIYNLRNYNPKDNNGRYRWVRYVIPFPLITLSGEEGTKEGQTGYLLPELVKTVDFNKRGYRAWHYPENIEVKVGSKSTNLLSETLGVVNSLGSLDNERALNNIKNQIYNNPRLRELLVFNAEFSFDDFLKFDGGTGITNEQRIKDATLSYGKMSVGGTAIMGIKAGLVLFIPNSNTQLDQTQIEYVNNKTPWVTPPEDLQYFYSDKLKRLYADPDFVPISELYRNTGENIINVGHELSVWVYARSVDQILDLTLYVKNLSITKNKNTGQFNIVFPYLPARSAAMYNFSTQYTPMSVAEMNHVTTMDIGGEISFGHALFSAGDIVFIKFEEMLLEDRKKASENTELFLNFPVVPKESLAGQIYDMIGSIDTVSEQVSSYYEMTSYVVISGRDCAKLLEDDGAQVFPHVVSQSAARGISIGVGDIASKLLMHRFIGDGELYGATAFFAQTAQRVTDIFKYYLDTVATTGSFPIDRNDTFFAAYGDRRQTYVDAKGNEKLKSGLYQIIELHTDKNLEGTYLVDATTANPQGSLSYLLSKNCQYPFVEWVSNVYTDTFDILVRRPPVNLAAYKSVLQEEPYPFIVSREQVLSYNLTMTKNFYTFFWLDPKGAPWTATSSNNMGYAPIVFLDEYINLWGNKPFHIVSEYVHAKRKEGSDLVEIDWSYLNRCHEDIVYLVESLQYLPFTREGTIKLPFTERRIKQGHFIEVNLMGKPELFYVESVSFDVEIDLDRVMSSTTLQVSRGMVMDYIIPESSNSNYSYFNIVNTDLLKDILSVAYKYQDNPIPGMEGETLVNKDVFNFFLQGNQFEDPKQRDKGAWDNINSFV